MVDGLFEGTASLIPRILLLQFCKDISISPLVTPVPRENQGTDVRNKGNKDIT